MSDEELTADQIVAMWANGREDDALDAIERGTIAAAAMVLLAATSNDLVRITNRLVERQVTRNERSM